ncbi:unannotated protein [freshwater metagenome]|uniref:Unannotated protein n=1 Tax=freshwater metagenome TaxID=449393 RepID=A0A6J6ZNU3_9ZZZZ
MTHVSASVICPAGTALSTVPYALTINGAINNPFINSAIDSAGIEFAKSKGIDPNVRPTR